jgi:hypothetical protein
VAQSLGNQALVGIFTGSICPSRIIVVFVVFALDKVLSVVVLELGTFVKDLVDEGVNKLDHIARAHKRYHFIVELVDNVGADEHGLDVVLHFLGVVGERVDIFGYLDDVLLLEFLVLHEEGVAHGSLGEGVQGDVDRRVDLALLQERLLPVDLHALVLHDEPRVAY